MVRGVADQRRLGREGNASGGNPLMDDHEQSDRPVVPANSPNNPGRPGAEVGEGRGLPEGNTASETRPGRSAGLGVFSDLDRVRQVARKDKDVRFTALLHHVTVDRLREAYRAISPDAAAGVDGVTWRDYGQDLEANLSRSSCSGSSWGVPSESDSPGVHTEARWAAAAAWGRRRGGQDPSAGGGRGPERRVSSRTFWVSHTGFGRGEGRMMRWTRSRSRSRAGR